MESPPPPPISPSPSTPTSGDEDYQQETAVSGASPVPKRRAVASSGSGIPQHSGGRSTRRGQGDPMSVHGGKVQISQGPGHVSLSTGGGPRDELLDVAYMNELKALIGDPFDDTQMSLRK